VTGAAHFGRITPKGSAASEKLPSRTSFPKRERVSTNEAVSPPRGDQPPARHILRERAVAEFLKDPYDPEGAIPNAILTVVGGPRMWSDEPVTASQFTSEQRNLLLRAFAEIRSIYQAAGGRIQHVPRLVEGIGLMPAGAIQLPYQSEKWAAARAMYVADSYRYSPDLPEDELLDARLTQAYFVVINWLDWIKGGLLDASAIYEEEGEEDEPPVSDLSKD
jgi:hypothetical protein